MHRVVVLFVVHVKVSQAKVSKESSIHVYFVWCVIHKSFTLLTLTTVFILSVHPLCSQVCKDNSCNNNEACIGANIDYVVGPSCGRERSCAFATIGSVDSGCGRGGSISSRFMCQAATIGSVVSSCNDEFSCLRAQLSGVDLINSCNAVNSCQDTKGYGAFEELIDCCSDQSSQCIDKDGLDIVVDGCVSVKCALLFVFI